MANYRIEFLDAENNPMAGCHFQIMHYFQVLQDGIADSQGRGVFRSDLIKNKKIWLRFWGKGQTQESAFASQTFLWQENVVTQPVKAPTIYEVDLRESENNNNEPAEYRQAFYEVQAGDTWESIAEKCETEAVLIRLVNNLQDDAPLEVGDALLLPRGAKRPLKQSLANKEVMPSIEADALHKVLLELEEKKDKKSKAPEPTQPHIQDNPQTVPEVKKEPAPQLPKQQEPPKKSKLEQMRSADNGKPEVKATSSNCPRCAMLTDDEIVKIFTNATKTKRDVLISAFLEVNHKFGLDTCQQKAHFFAQVLQEVGVSINISSGESLNYAVEALPAHFSKFSVTGRLRGAPNELAYKYGRIQKGSKIIQKANQEMIANIAYANRNGNGNIASGDGWKYRGRGIIQVTGKDKYMKINYIISKYYSSSKLVIDANNINQLREGTIASMAYWVAFGCKKEADRGVTRANLDAIVDIVNRHTPTRNARWENLKKCITIFKVNDCERNKK